MMSKNLQIPGPGGDAGDYPQKKVYEQQRKRSVSTASSLSLHDSYTKEIHKEQASHRYKPKLKPKYSTWTLQSPPKASSLKSWLQVEVKDGVSPFPNDQISLQKSGNSDEDIRQGKELNPSTSTMSMESKRIAIHVSLPFGSATKNRQMSLLENDQYIDKELKDKIEHWIEPTVNTGKDSAWTDDMQSTMIHEESPLRPQSFKMVFPEPNRSVCNTAEWSMEQQQQTDGLEAPTQIQDSIRESLLKDVDSPSMLEAARISDLPKTPKLGVSVSIKSMKGEVHYVNSVKIVKGNLSGSQSRRKTVQSGDEDRRIERVGESGEIREGSS